jgi:thymidylate synthase ThyX
MRIYALKNLPSEVVAVTFAKCSRSPESFDKIAAELSVEQSADFNEKWVVNYGHASIAEHAFINIAIEDVSLLAVEAIQSNRLGSYTEKSSRYQIYSRDRIYLPDILEKEPALKKSYLDIINHLFDIYEKSIEPIKKEIYRLYPNTAGEPETIWQGKIKSKWVDICRFLLPNCVLTNLGATMNARSWEYAIIKMLSHPLSEVKQIGRKIKEVALSVTPILVKYAEPNKYYIQNEKYLFHISTDKYPANTTEIEFSADNKLRVDLIEYDPEAENKILAALLYKYQPLSLHQALKKVKDMNENEKKEIFKNILNGARSIYDKPPRELEYADYTFDCLLDQGAYYDLKRNRIMTQTPQILHGQYGYFTPKIFDRLGLGDDYRYAMEKAHNFSQDMAHKYPYEAQYITTKATARRFIMKMNLREAFYFIGLRSKKTGHFMYRQIAQMIYEHISRVHPYLAKYILVDKT